MRQDSAAKLQILTLATKVIVLTPSIPLLSTMAQYLFSLARYDADYDVRDRSRFLHSLLKGVIVKPDMTNGEDSEENDHGGVVLRREQVKVVVLGQRSVKDEVDGSGGTEYQVGSMSRAARRKLAGYADLPEWTDDPTDSSLRDSEVRRQRAQLNARLIYVARQRARSGHYHSAPILLLDHTTRSCILISRQYS